MPQKTAPQDAAYDPYAMDRDKIKSQTSRGAQFWKPAKGQNTIRILPIKGQGTFLLKAFVHFVRTPDRFTSFHCPISMDEGGRCYACEMWTRLRGSDDENDQRDAAELRPKVQFYSAIVDLTTKQDTEKGVQVYRYGTQVMGQLTNLQAIEDYAEMFHPVRGRDVFITQVQLGQTAREVRYDVTAGGKEKPILNMEWLDEVPDLLESVVSFLPYDEQKTLFNATFMEEAGTPAAKGPMRVAPEHNVVVDPSELDFTKAPPLGEPVTILEGAPRGVPAAVETQNATVECEACESSILATAKFCPECGTVQTGDLPKEPTATAEASSTANRIADRIAKFKQG